MTALIIFIIAAITDWMDGMLARKLDAQSHFGRMLDPIADKLLLVGCLLALAGIDGWARGAWWELFFPALLIMLREILISGLREYVAAHKIILPVTWVAKTKTTMQLVAVGFAIALPVAPGILSSAGIGFAFPVNGITIALMWVATALTIISGWDYFTKAMRHDIFS